MTLRPNKTPLLASKIYRKSTVDYVITICVCAVTYDMGLTMWTKTESAVLP